MKKMLILIFYFFLFILLTNCGSDGKPGKAYVALRWGAINGLGGFVYLPSTIYNSTFYEHPAGSCSGWYYDVYDYYWSVYYIITVNPGAKGGLFFINGEDGKDKYFTIWLLSGGPDMTTSAYIISKSQSIYLISTNSNNDKLINNQNESTPKNISLYDLSNPVTNIVIEYDKGEYHLKIEYKQYIKR